MIGILCCSHGDMAKGMLDSSKLFFAGEVAQMEALSLVEGESPEEFDQQVLNTLERIDDGHGVVIFCDLMGGTPANRVSMMLQNPSFAERRVIITGMNLSMLLEFLGMREALNDIKDLDVPSLMNIGKDGILCVNDLLK